MSYRGGGGSGRKVCPFFLKGNCRFGDDCRNEHPRSQQQSYNQDSNRFSAFQNGGNDNNRGGDRYRPNDNRKPLPYGLNRDHIRADVTSGGPDGERPSWPMSCYAPTRDVPRHLIEGPEYEISPEEVRVLYYLAQASGDPAQVRQYEQNEHAAAAKSEQAASEIRNDPDRFIKLIINAENVHPNRVDQTVRASGIWQRPTSISQSGAFSAPSSLAVNTQTPNTGWNHGGNAGAFATNQTSGFGAPSALGPNRQSPFAQPATGNGFQQAPAASGAFGAPSLPFGGQATATTPASAFGAPSNMGANPSPFATQTITTPSGFGQPSTLGAQPAAPAFGKPSGFGSPSPFATGSNGFSGPTQSNASPFATSSVAQQNVAMQQSNSSGGFGSPSSFAGVNNNTAASQTAQTNGFGTASAFPVTSQAVAQNGFGFGQQGPANSAFSNKAVQQPATQNTISKLPAVAIAAPVSTYTTRHPNGTLQSWKGERVTWRQLPGDEAGPPIPTIRNAGSDKPERIWFPNGPPPNSNTDAEALPEDYDASSIEVLKRAYQHIAEVGEFEDGLMPETPPKREWIRWDI